VYGTADLIVGRPIGELSGFGTADGYGSTKYIRITPATSWSYCLTGVGLTPESAREFAELHKEDERLNRNASGAPGMRRTVHDPALQVDRSRFWVARPLD